MAASAKSMTDRPLAPPKPLTPARVLKQSGVIYVFIHVVAFFVMAAFDAQRDFYYFRFFALGLIWAAASIVVSAFLSTRRAWLGQPPADIRDGIIPACIIFVLGWAIWTLVHYLAG